VNITKRNIRVRTVATVALIAIAPVALTACGENVAPPPRRPSTGEELPTRHVPLEGQPNFRDLGGYRATDGRTVKWGQVYRSGELAQLTDEDVATLDRLELRTVVNFLLPEEIDQHGPDRLPAGTRAVAASISSARAATLTRQVQESINTADFDAIPPELNPEFHRILLEDGREEYAALLRELADPANRPLAFHCSHGIHRTGTATAILLSALGVPWETIQEDYLLSNELRRVEIDRQLEKIRRVAADRQGVPLEDVEMINVEAFYVLDGTYIDGTLEHAIEEYGSMKAYVRDGLGLTDEEIEVLRGQLLESTLE
jgi:protein-tyrosine phosphatase